MCILFVQSLMNKTVLHSEGQIGNPSIFQTPSGIHNPNLYVATLFPDSTMANSSEQNTLNGISCWVLNTESMAIHCIEDRLVELLKALQLRKELIYKHLFISAFYIMQKTKYSTDGLGIESRNRIYIQQLTLPNGYGVGFAEQRNKKKYICDGNGLKHDIQYYSASANLQQLFVVQRGMNKIQCCRKQEAAGRITQMITHILNWAEVKDIQLQTIYIPCASNSTAESLSRLTRSGHYSIAQVRAQQVMKMLGIHAQIDAFATRRNKVFKTYRSPRQNNRVMARDGLTIDWNEQIAWLHPPIPLIGRCFAEDLGRQCTNSNTDHTRLVRIIFETNV
ncbi:MAG: hypothetical protein EZS28_036770 [Streblomastix strix]|uniref:Uncharacterized protein n=1 Tax=Streblomastix strix TaxID=222440 RepID=A0A5J4UC16_9EUKA|nr:MAG: hypothetical protein EZS28_036770 [Streblomastix strix]